MQTLARNAEQIKASPNARINFGEHCDGRRTQAYNLVLGEKRTKTVQNYLYYLCRAWHVN